MLFRRRVSRILPTDQATFANLLARARARESEALGTLYRQFLSGVFGYIAARVADRSTAEDLTSEVFLQMVEEIQQVRATSEASFAAWLLQIARGTVAGYYRKREKQPLHIPLELDTHNKEEEESQIATSRPESDPVQWTEARAEWEHVVQAINLLTEEQRQVLIGRLILGYDVATVAQMLGKQANAVKALQFRALQSLHRLLQKQNAPAQVVSSQTRRSERQKERP